ncbi:MAG: sigma-70 family RNA polymerase sigma factor [Candidatus Promineifilaceae bacterium]
MSKDASFDHEGKLVTALTDNMLLERIGRGDIASFETLFYRHYDRVYGLLFRLLGNRVEAEDVTQEVFLKLYRQPTQKGFIGRQEHNVGAWLYRVATNMGYNHIRARKRRWQRNTALVPDSTDALPGPAERAVQEETRISVRNALSKLPRQQTQLLLMRQMGFNYAELAEACEIAPGSVGKMLSRAAEAFRKVYEEESEI